VGKAIQQAMHTALKVPLEERFHIFTEHAPVDLVIDPTYLGIERSADAIVVQVTLNEGRDAEVKRGFYRTLADLLRERIGLRQEDLVINLVEVKRENWSFGNGKAQLV
jgi:phenylpyruvate tautomerase PptA (4-oxalocrotonate tautomerase family)